jgi:sodium transport system permease protein
MNWRNIRLIYAREIRDQLRDRRTLFMIAVLPLLLYPLLGMSVFQLSQFLHKTRPTVLVIGSDQLSVSKDLPVLFSDGHFSPGLFDDSTEAERLQVVLPNGRPANAGAEADSTESAASPLMADDELAMQVARARLKNGDVQVVLNFPPDFGQRLSQLRMELRKSAGRSGRSSSAPSLVASPNAIDIPEPELLYNSAQEKSRAAYMQVEHVVDAWKAQLVRENLLVSRIPTNVTRPFQFVPLDVAERVQQQAMMWSKVLPFVLFIWALTGAFYPAVDLCAGEKERGTLETLLSSPAQRSEIVWGKLLTVMTFSMATALLNLVSLGFTAHYIILQLQSLPSGALMEGFDLPPLAATGWLLVALLPMSALFSALCLACAAFARSTKEGQYYLMPLLLVTMPLMMLPMAPGSELNLGNSLIPVTGVVLLLKGLVQGNYTQVLPYVVPVCGMTLICCHLAIRWAVYQFNQESVLFRESERLDLRRWVVHLIRDRQDTPSLAEAFVCVALIFVIQFFTRLAISGHVPAKPDFSFLTLIVFISQVVCIALPALMMTLLFTGRPLKTMLLDRLPQVSACVAAVLLAVLLQPLGQQIVIWINHLYPPQEDVLSDLQAFSRLLETAPYAWLPFLLMAVLPAFCEEITFRGFILSGLRHVGKKWWAIGLSAVFFGMAHTAIQQSIAATGVGLVLGYLAVQSGSLVPGMLFHMTYNSLMLASMRLPDLVERWPALKSVLHEVAPGQLNYTPALVLACAVLAAAVLAWFHRLPYQATKEEYLSDVRARLAHQPAGE